MTRQPSSIRVFAAVAAAALVLAAVQGQRSQAQGQARQGEWRHYSGDNGGKKYAMNSTFLISAPPSWWRRVQA